jgi:hypothetical protein
MMAMIEADCLRKLVLLAAALALALSTTGCAAPGATGVAGPVSSHGVDYIPAFDAPYAGDG